MNEPRPWDDQLGVLKERINKLENDFEEFTAVISLSLEGIDQAAESTICEIARNLTELIKTTNKATVDRCLVIGESTRTLLEDLTAQILKISEESRKV